MGGKERRLSLASAQAIVAHAEFLSQAGGESHDSRLPLARGIVEARARVAAETLTDQARRIRREPRIKRPVRTLSVAEFCGPRDGQLACDNFREPNGCYWYERFRVEYIVETGTCGDARIERKAGTMTRTGFKPRF